LIAGLTAAPPIVIDFAGTLDLSTAILQRRKAVDGTGPWRNPGMPRRAIWIADNTPEGQKQQKPGEQAAITAAAERKVGHT
jgi:hypothetical protein